MKVSFSDDPMVISNSIKFIYGKYEGVFLFINKKGLMISYVDWFGNRVEKQIGEYS